MAKPQLWGDLEIGASLEQARKAHPKFVVREGALCGGCDLFGCEFDIKLDFDELGLASATLQLARTLVSQRFDDVLPRVLAAMRQKHGQGSAIQRSRDVTRKRWQKRWVTIELVAVDDPAFETICITFQKVAITDAAFRYL